MLCSPRKPSNMMRIFSSAEYCFRVARRISLTTRSDDTLVVSDFCLIFASPWSYDEPEILPCSTRPFCLTSADGGQADCTQFEAVTALAEAPPGYLIADK